MSGERGWWQGQGQMDRQLSRRHSLLLWQVVRFPTLSRAEIVSSLIQ